MIARAFPNDRPCRFQKFEATETILATGTTIWKPGLKKLWCCVGGGDQNKSLVLSNELINVELPHEFVNKLVEWRSLIPCGESVPS